MKSPIVIAALVVMPVTSLSRAAEEVTPINLQPYANQKLSEGFGTEYTNNTLGELPRGEQRFGDCKYQIGEGLIQLGSTAIKQTMPERVEGIKIDRKLTKLHIVHATQCGGGPNKPGDAWFVEDDTLIGAYRINFQDRSAVIIPIVYGQDVRDWFFVDGEKQTQRSEIVWTGDNDFARDAGARIRLYATTWENPWPDKKVTTIDYISRKGETPAAPFCVAMTAEGPGVAAPSVPLTAAMATRAGTGIGRDKESTAQDSSSKFAFYTVDHYDDNRDPAEDLKTTIARAKAEKKNILIQVGGDWCGWCKLMSQFIETDDKVKECVSSNYLLMKVTYDQNNKNVAFLSQYPEISGYPHLFVLDSDGKLLHSQGTAELEEGHGYNERVYLEFLEKWKPGK